ncbi:hypothetical protein V8C40DRAFT_229376 [Trichoderma camerunense]
MLHRIASFKSPSLVYLPLYNPFHVKLATSFLIVNSPVPSLIRPFHLLSLVCRFMCSLLIFWSVSFFSRLSEECSQMPVYLEN